jgi:hypothetical protein
MQANDNIAQQYQRYILEASSQIREAVPCRNTRSPRTLTTLLAGVLSQLCG